MEILQEHAQLVGQQLPTSLDEAVLWAQKGFIVDKRSSSPRGSKLVTGNSIHSRVTGVYTVFIDWVLNLALEFRCKADVCVHGIVCVYSLSNWRWHRMFRHRLNEIKYLTLNLTRWK